MSSIRSQERKAKTVFSLEAPVSLSNPQWPIVSPDTSNTVLDLLHDLLQPIGELKRITQSYSNNDTDESTKTRKRKRVSEPDEVSEVSRLESSLLIGFNNVTRRLEQLARKTTPSSLPEHLHPQSSKSADRSLDAVFVCRSDSQPSVLHAHIPTLCAITGARLFQLPKGAEHRLCRALGVSRVGILALTRDKTEKSNVLRYLEENNIGTVKKPSWLATMKPEYQKTKIKATLTTAPVLSKKQKKTVVSMKDAQSD